MPPEQMVESGGGATHGTHADPAVVEPLLSWAPPTCSFREQMVGGRMGQKLRQDDRISYRESVLVV